MSQNIAMYLMLIFYDEGQSVKVEMIVLFLEVC